MDYMENTSVRDAYRSRPDAQSAVLTSIRPYPGLVRTSQSLPFSSLNGEAIDTSGIDSLLVLVRVLEASGCQFPEDELTVEETALLRAARINLGRNKESDTKLKLWLIKIIFPELASTLDDGATYIDPPLQAFLNMPQLINIWKMNDHFRFDHSDEECLSPLQNFVAAATPVNTLDFQKADFLAQAKNGSVGVEKNADAFADILGFHPPFLRFKVGAVGATELDIKDVLRTTIVSWKKEGSRRVEKEVTYRLLMVIRHAGNSRLQDRVRVYKENGREAVSALVREKPLAYYPSVRKPEAWSLRDGGALTFIYKRVSASNIPVDEGVTEYDEDEAKKEAEFIKEQKARLQTELESAQQQFQRLETQLRLDQDREVAHSMQRILHQGNSNSRQSVFDVAPVGYEQVVLQDPPLDHYLIPENCQQCNKPKHDREDECDCFCEMKAIVHGGNRCPSACFCAPNAHHQLEDHVGACDFEHGMNGVVHPAMWCDLCQVCGTKSFALVVGVARKLVVIIVFTVAAQFNTMNHRNVDLSTTRRASKSTSVSDASLNTLWAVRASVWMKKAIQ